MAYILDGTFPFIHKNRGISLGTGAGGSVPVTWDDWYYNNPWDFASAGVKVNSETALKQSAYWRATNLLSSQLADFPIDLFRRLPGGERVEVTDHPVLKLLKRKPNDAMNALVWREAMQANVLTRGNGYSYIERDRRGYPLSFRLLNPENIEPVLADGSLIYRYGPNGIINSFEMFHLPGLSFDGLRGKAILEAAAESMGVGLAMQRYSAMMFKNGAKQTGVLMHPAVLSDQARQGLRRSFDSVMKGDEGGTLVLDEGMKWMSTGIPPDQAQLLQSKQFSVQEIARWFGIPPHLLMEESRSTFTNIEQQSLEFVRYTLTPWVARWEAEMNTKLLLEEEATDHYFKLNIDSMLRGEMKARYEAYAIGIEKGFLSPNDARVKEDMNRIPGGDVYSQQTNKQPLEKQQEDGK